MSPTKRDPYHRINITIDDEDLNILDTYGHRLAKDRSSAIAELIDTWHFFGCPGRGALMSALLAGGLVNRTPDQLSDLKRR